MDWRPFATLAALRERARMLDAMRSFFRERGVLEVETPILQGGANLDPGSQSHPVPCGREMRFLPTSPEHPLKRLVAAGYGPVWSLSPVVRLGERSARHQPEFRMLEWYRPGWEEDQLRREVIDLFDHLCGWGSACEIISYRDAFRRFCGIDPQVVTRDALCALLDPAQHALADDRDAALDWLLSTRIEPHLGVGTVTAITGYPPRLAAQARLRSAADGHPAAARFELYRSGIELANGYWELTDAQELERRLAQEREARGDARLTRDARFAAAMAAGLPPCAGVAVGFDRLVMLALGLQEVAAAIAFPWERA